jgi:hypothetical protein
MELGVSAEGRLRFERDAASLRLFMVNWQLR